MALRDLVEKPVYRYLMDIGLQPDFIAELKKGSLLIPAGLLRPQLEKAVAAEKGVTLARSDFNADGVRLELALARYGVRLNMRLRVEVSETCIDSRRQTIEVRIQNEQTRGANLAGKIASLVAGGWIQRMLLVRISKNGRVAQAQFDRTCGRFLVDLEGLPQIQRLTKKIPLVGLSVLDFFSVRKIEHVTDGLRMGR